MGLMLREKISEHADRVSKTHTHPDIAKSEAQTKASLIEPFLRCLRYNTSYLEQVALEVPTELGGKIDYVLTGQANTKIAVEAKRAGITLSEKETNQLRSYFTFSEAVVGILTNGVDYWLFTDLDKTNVMDSDPYRKIDVRSLTDKDIHHLESLTKNNINQAAIHEQAQLERYRTVVNEIVTQEFNSPSQEFLKLVGKKAGIKPLTKPNLMMLEPLVGQAISRIRGRPLPPSRASGSSKSPPSPTLASLFGNPLSAKTYRQVLIDVVIEMQGRYASTFAETISKEPFVKPKSTWKWISSNREDLSPVRETKQVGDYVLDVNLNARSSVARARRFLKAFGHSPTDLVVHNLPGPSKIKSATLFGEPIPAKTYIEMLTSVVSALQARHPNDFADRVRDPKVFRGTKRWIISKDPNDLGTAKSKKKVGDYWVYAGGTGRVPRAHKFLGAFGYSPEELKVYTSDD